MTPRHNAHALATKLGAVINTQKAASHFEIRVAAPAGKYWLDGTVHELVCTQFEGFDTRGMWLDILDRMETGVDACSAQCEWV